jgi:branched-chain amino acid aminotransferase
MCSIQYALEPGRLRAERSGDRFEDAGRGGELSMPSGRQPTVHVNVNGRITPAAEAMVPAMDHGFLYGDSVYETVRTFDRVPFLLGPHLERLERSMARIDLAPPLSRVALEREIQRTISEVPIRGDVAVRIVISRGRGPIGLVLDVCREPSWVIYVIELIDGPTTAWSEPDGPDGGIAVVVSSVRRNSPRALDPAIKSGNFLNNILAFRDATRAGAQEAILCSAEGFLAEGTTSNVFLVSHGVIETPRDEGILDGITRTVLFEEARAAGCRIVQKDLLPSALFTADEAFITSSIRGVLPIAKADGRAVGAGKRGPVTLELQRLYRARVERECALA